MKIEIEYDKELYDLLKKTIESMDRTKAIWAEKEKLDVEIQTLAGKIDKMKPRINEKVEKMDFKLGEYEIVTNLRVKDEKIWADRVDAIEEYKVVLKEKKKEYEKKQQEKSNS